MLRSNRSEGLSHTKLNRLFETESFATVVRLLRTEIRATGSKLPRHVLQHALALALIGQTNGDLEHRAAMQRAGMEPSLNHANAIKEAIAIFEELIRLDTKRRQEAEAFGDIAAHLGEALQRARAAGHQEHLLSPPSESEKLLRHLLEEATRLVTGGELVHVEALLTRAHQIALTLEDEGGPHARATIHILRILREYLGDRCNATAEVNNAAREDELDAGRFAYTPADRDAYLNLFTDIFIAAWKGNRGEIAQLVMSRALDIHRERARQTCGQNELAGIIQAIGRAAALAGNMGHALCMFEELRRMAETGAVFRSWLAAAWAGLGRAWIGLGDPEMGLPLLHRALAEGPDAAQPGWHTDALVDLYEASIEEGDAATARRCHDVLTRGGDLRGTSPDEIAARAAEQDDPRKAADIYQGVLNSASRQRLRAGASRRISLRLTRLLARMGETERAYKLINEKYQIFNETLGSQHPVLSEVEETIATLECALGRHKLGLTALFRAVARDFRSVQHLLQFGASTQQGRLLEGMRRRTEAAIGLVAEHFPDSPDLIAGAHALVTRKSLNVGVEWEKACSAAASADSNPEVRAARDRLAELRAQLARQALEAARGKGTPGDDPAGTLRRKEEQERELAYLIGGVSIAGLAQAPEPTAISMCIPAHSTYVELVLYSPIRLPHETAPRPPRYCAFVLHARMQRWHMVELGFAADIDKLVTAFRGYIMHEADPSQRFATVEAPRVGARTVISKEAKEAGLKLRRRLFDPLLPAIGERTRLVVVPVGPLFFVPLECLPADHGGRLIDKYCISYVSSA
ncbi:hypothetical protein [Falsiroseomonas sp. E2-1-a20]|uniref:hypothetical protein n=1 Tax=Falsiroseomonas sp. E2-1-a20 TaxID=3239300 RepID=UPI003F311479